MMSKEEAKLRATQLVKQRRVMEAAWITTMLSTAPDSISKSEMRMIRFAFFRGAHCLFDFITLAGDDKNENSLTQLLDDLKDELNRFFKEQKRLKDQLVNPPTPSRH